MHKYRATFESLLASLLLGFLIPVPACAQAYSQCIWPCHWLVQTSGLRCAGCLGRQASTCKFAGFSPPTPLQVHSLPCTQLLAFSDSAQLLGILPVGCTHAVPARSFRCGGVGVVWGAATRSSFCLGGQSVRPTAAPKHQAPATQHTISPRAWHLLSSLGTCPAQGCCCRSQHAQSHAHVHACTHGALPT